MAGAPDLSEFAAEQGHPGASCGVAVVLGILSDDERTKLLAALSSTYQHAAISRVVKKWGHNCTPHAIAKHRREQCACVPPR